MKRSEQFLDVFGDIREEWVTDADQAGKVIPLWAKVISAAAIICAVGTALMLLFSPKPEQTGASLASAVESVSPETDIVVDTPSTPESDNSLEIHLDSPYVVTDTGLNYEQAAWGMSKDAVIEAQGLNEADWEYSSNNSAELRGTYLDQFPDGVVQISYEFHVFRLDQLFSLDRIYRNYDPEQVTFAALLAQRTAELGNPSSSGETEAVWQIGDTVLTLEQTKNILMERLEFSPNLTYAPDEVFALYLGRLSPPGVTLGLSWNAHIEQGLLQEDAGEIKETETADGNPGFTFTFDSELYGIPVTAEYLFGPTLLDPEEEQEDYVLKAASFTPVLPADRDALDSAVTQAVSGQMILQGTTWVSMSLGNLTDSQVQTGIAEAVLADGSVASLDEAIAGFYEWPLVSVYWNENGALEFNGTGAALYCAAVEHR